MKKLLFIVVLVCISPCLFAQQNTTDSARQFLLIIRYKSNMPAPSAEVMKTIGQHWGQFIGELAQSGKLVTGYRPGTDGKTISGNAKTTTDGAYASNNQVISSLFIIKAANLEEATAIAQKCPIYEMDGSVEIRPISNTAP